MQTNFGRDLYQDLMALVNEQDSPFYIVDHLFNGTSFRVFNYRLASYSDFLKPSALEARGVMFELDSDKKFVRLASLTPRKFFNNKENPLVMDVDFGKTELIMDKMDGSIMTTFTLPIADVVYLKSKTSVSSEQAIAANDFLRSGKVDKLLNYLMYMQHAGYSVTLEWTAPQHRIVLPYQEPNLTVLSARSLDNGEHMPYALLQKDMEEFGCEEHLVKDYLQTISPDRVQEFIDNIRFMKDIEGYVIFADGVYTKHKTDWYCALHHTKDSISSDRRLFECVVQEGHDDLRGMFADDAFSLQRIDEMEQRVKNLYVDLERIVFNFYHANKELDRKDYAIKGQQDVPRLYFSLAMNLYLGKSNNYQEWMIKHYKELGIKDDAQDTGNSEEGE